MIRNLQAGFMSFLEIQEIYTKIQIKEQQLGKKYEEWENIDKILFLYNEDLVNLSQYSNKLELEKKLVKKKSTSTTK